MEERKIWILHPYATPPNLRGLVRPYKFGLNLIGFGFGVTVFSSSYLHYLDKNLIENGELYINTVEDGVNFNYVKTHSSSKNGLFRIWNFFSYYISVMKTAKLLIASGEKPKLILGSSPHPLAAYAAIRLARKLSVPSVVEIRDLWPDAIFRVTGMQERGIFGKILLRGERWIYENADRIIFLKEGDRDYIVERGWDLSSGEKIDLDKCIYINNGVDVESFRWGEVSEGFNIVYVGSLRLVNDIDRILDVAGLLLDYKEIQFYIYGDGGNIDNLKKRVVDERLKNVHFMGYADKEQLPKILGSATVNLLHYSQSKYNWSRGSSSNKLFEYMASGRPILSSVKIGYSPIEKYMLGISVEEDSIEAFRDAILNLYRMDEEELNRMGRRARRVAEDYDYKVLSNKLFSLLEEVIE